MYNRILYLHGQQLHFRLNLGIGQLTLKTENGSTLQELGSRLVTIVPKVVAMNMLKHLNPHTYCGNVLVGTLQV
jgi:hypothetical protein